MASEREETSTTSSDKRQRYIRVYYDNIFTKEKQEELERLLVQFQADNCLPDRFVEKGSTVRQFTFLNRACATALPKRKEMTRILDKYSHVEEEEQLVALKHRMTSSAIFGTIFTFGLFSTGSTDDGLAIGEQMESVMQDVTAKGCEIGAVVRDDAGQCDRARRILALRHPRIAFIHGFAHDINNLVKSVLNTSFRTLTKQASLATVTLNASSFKWLVRAQALGSSAY
ncbi:hypothetical protein L916_14553 [Phytophthora nicotianae]|uniref:DUF659 domain-containing protein n=2 Tax=Phytophthora nicotianae TaxID=4792 RepID=W2IF91_PHYNI|nr:hypothetical protein L916_14553 [Phytophthora nicotianae]